MTKDQADIEFEGMGSTDEEDNDFPNEKEYHATKKNRRHKDVDFTLPIGVIQLINTHDGRWISEYDRLKFQQMQYILGMAIQNCAEIHSASNIKLGVFGKLKNLHKHIE